MARVVLHNLKRTMDNGVVKMREFNETDKKRKKTRIEIPENPAGLSPEKLAELEESVKSSLKNGYLACPVAWTLAKKDDVPRIAVGAMTDKIGFRITDCQLGCFKVDKTLYSEPPREILNPEMIAELERLDNDKQLTCEKAFELSAKYGQKPMVVGNEASARNIKIRNCQLGCF
jgi:hypothetical protein